MSLVLSEPELPSNLIAFDEIAEDYPGLTVEILDELALALDVPVLRLRLPIPGKRFKATVVAMDEEDISKIEDTFLPLLEDYVELDDQDFEQSSEPESEAIEVDSAGKSVNGKTYLPSHRLALELEIPQQTLDPWAIKHEIFPTSVRFPGRSVCVSYDLEQCDALREVVAERRKLIAGNDICSLGSIRTQLKIGRVRLANILKDLDITPQKKYFGAVLGDGITRSEKKKLLGFLKSEVPKRAPKNVKSVDGWAHKLGTSPALLFDLARGANIPLKKYLFNGHSAYGLTSAQIKEIKSAYDPAIMRKVLPISVNKIARSNNMASATLIKLAIGAGINPETYRLNGFINGKGLRLDEIEAIRTAYEPFNRETPLRKSEMTIEEICESEQIPIEIIDELLEGTVIRAAHRKQKNGDHCSVLSRKQLDLLSESYADFAFAK